MVGSLPAPRIPIPASFVTTTSPLAGSGLHTVFANRVGGHGREEPALIALPGREVVREAGLAPLEPPVDVAVAHRPVPPLVLVHIGLLEERITCRLLIALGPGGL